MASSSSRNMITTTEGKLEMFDMDREVCFVCTNFASSYMAGVVILPRDFCLEFGDRLPERLLLHVPGKTVWNGVFRKDRSWIEGLDKMMKYYKIKPYHMILFEYYGGPSFNIEIYNPYAVEINYSIPPFIGSSSSEGRNVLDVSDIEIDKLCGNFCYNAYNNGHGLLDLVLGKKHLRKTNHYKIFKRNACRKLCIFESMDWVKLCFKNLIWRVKLKWMAGKVYLDRKWYSFAKADNFKEGDTLVFQMTGKPQKFEVSIFESDVLLNCNTKGLGHQTGVMNWFKMINENILRSGQMEIPRIVMEGSGAIFHDQVNLKMGDAKTVVVEFCAARNFLTGMSQLVKQYHVEENDVLVFKYVSPSTFVVGFFKSSGMAFNYSLETTIVSTTTNIVQEPEVILISDSSVEMVEDAMVIIDNHDEANKIDFGAVDIVENILFEVTLKKSHVDGKCHGVYLPKTMYSTFNSWRHGTIVTLICGDNVYHVAALRNQKICRLGRGWTEFTIANEIQEGQILEFIYVGDKTFHVFLA